MQLICITFLVCLIICANMPAESHFLNDHDQAFSQKFPQTAKIKKDPHKAGRVQKFIIFL